MRIIIFDGELSSMKLLIENNKLYKKTLFSKTEVDAGEINRIERDDKYTTVYLKSGSSIAVKYSLNFLYENELLYCVSNNVFYEDKTYKGNSYVVSELKDKLEQTRKKAQNIASTIVKENLGENYDIVASIEGEYHFNILVFKLVENGIVLNEHETYEEIVELGGEKAIDDMYLSFLIKWDSASAEGLFGVTNEVEDDEVLKSYITHWIITKMRDLKAELQKKLCGK